MACVCAFEPVGPVPAHVAASASTRPGSRLASLSPLAPTGTLEPGGAFHWQARGVEPPFTFVLLDAACRPLLRRDGLTAPAFDPDAPARAVLAAAGTCHWYVLGDACGRPVASPLARVDSGGVRTVGGTVR